MGNGRTYAIPAEDIRTYVDRAVRDLGVDPQLIDDVDSTMYAWRLSHQPKNLEVAREVLGLPGADLSHLARAMADASADIIRAIERDQRYSIPPLPSQEDQHWAGGWLR